MSETSSPEETFPLPEGIVTNPLAQGRYTPHLERAAAIAVEAINEEELYGPIARVQSTYRASMDEFILAASLGKDIDFDPVTLAVNSAVVGSMVEVGPLVRNDSGTQTVETRTSRIQAEMRREYLANITRDYLSASSLLLANQGIEGEVPVETVVEAGIMAAQHIETLDQEGLLQTLDPKKKISASKTSWAALKRVGAVIDEALEENPTETVEELDRVVDIYQNYPESHRRLSRFALKAMLADDPNILIEAAQRIEEQAGVTFARAA